jgi:thiol-disulfide isomerase/thioredoxin
MNWIKKRWSDILWIVFILLLFIPQTGKPIRVFISRTLAFSPSVQSVHDRQILENYQWRLRKINGEIVDFETIKGKKIIVNFWATWCPPCIAEMPSFQTLYDDYNRKAVFLFVSNEEHSVLKKFMTKYDLDLPIYQAINDNPKALDSNSLPTTFLMDENGNILIKKVGAANWNSEKVRILLEQ